MAPIYKNPDRERARLRWIATRTALMRVLFALGLNGTGNIRSVDRANYLLGRVWTFPKDTP